MRDPYTILGVNKNASQDDIKKAYRRLAKKLHPDVNPGNNKKVEQQFKDVSAAYDLLGDSAKRQRFDRGEIDASGAERPEHAFWRAQAGAGRGGQEAGVDPGDLFAELFGRRRRRGFAARGEDATYTLEVEFLEAATGGTRRLQLPDGRVLDVAIPAGSTDRQMLRLKGQGGPGFGDGPAGDAFIEIHIKPHAFFSRKDNDIHVEVPVTLPEAALGAKITVPTVDGAVSLTVPPGSNTGTVLRLKGKGIVERGGGQRGDQYVKLKVVLPERPDRELVDILERWSKTHDYDVRGPAGMRK